MLGFLRNEVKAQLRALNKSQAVIEFQPDGTVLTANENFLNTLGYTLAEIKGQHHSIFLSPAEQSSPEYKRFWDRLRNGEYQAAEYKRLGKHGKEVWIQASYNPLLDADGKAYKIVKYATDITPQKQQNADFAGQINAIGVSQAVIQFNMDGTIISANENFLNALGYSMAEIQNKHHSMFVDPVERSSKEYARFWDKLKQGEYVASEFKRIGKDGKEIWIQASYNPILDLNGKAYKVVKFATDITSQVMMRLENERVKKMVKTIIDENLGAVATSITSANRQSSNVAAVSQQTSSNVQAVASAAEEMNASVREISQNMVRSKAAVDDVYEQAASADLATQRLITAAQAMSGIVELIQDIAGQINLLALNATIESARAGEAGKGFAVVASEVKHLASQTTNATVQISKEIDEMQSVSNEAGKALGTIKQSIDAVREYVTNVASAMEEQTAVTREISANMQTAAEGVSSITTSINEIVLATNQADSATKQVRDASLSLSSQAA